MTSPSDPSPRVRLARRTALRGALALPALLAVSSLTTARAGDEPADGRDDEIAAFLERWHARTREAVEAGSTDDDGHLHALLSDLARLDVTAFPPRKVDAYSDEHFTSGPILGSPEFLVLEFEMAPDAIITPHNHVGYSFVSVGVEGETTVRHYEPEPGSPAPDVHDTPFALREVQRTLVTRGRSSSLTRTRANIHGFRAGPAGARFLDFGVHHRDAGGGYTTFSKLVIDETPSDAARGVHTARWIGNPKD